MNSLANAARTLVRSIIIAAGVVALALVAARPAGAEENSVFDFTVALMISANEPICEGAGGTLEVTTQRTPGSGLTVVTLFCKGGAFNGWACIFDNYGWFVCPPPTPNTDGSGTPPFSLPDEPPAVEPTGGVEPEPEPTVPTTEVA